MHESAQKLDQTEVITKNLKISFINLYVIISTVVNYNNGTLPPICARILRGLGKNL